MTLSFDVMSSLLKQILTHAEIVETGVLKPNQCPCSVVNAAINMSNVTNNQLRHPVIDRALSIVIITTNIG